ncbi:unnamed protein product [Soboliphyme baturini]|uniref:Transposase n=1 Tax=Soboliphyme baturini TaxID=241478 RepID=A0A183J2N3_9BILA|nr:unnamed protein product [Soboliphyme baturini]
MEYHTKIRRQKQPKNQIGNNNARRLEQIPVMTPDVETGWQLFKSDIFELLPNAADIDGLACYLEVRKNLRWTRECPIKRAFLKQEVECEFVAVRLRTRSRDTTIGAFPMKNTVALAPSTSGHGPHRIELASALATRHGQNPLAIDSD